METFKHRINLNFKVGRDINYPKFLEYLKNSASEDITDTIKILFYIRDKEKGKGERELFRHGILWIGINYPEKISEIIELIPKFGRWDDLFILFPNIPEFRNCDYVNANYCSDINEKTLIKFHELQNKVLEFFVEQLKKDLKNYLDNKNFSLAAKWAPSEGCQWNRLVKLICKKMDIHPKIYRKMYLTPLRKELGIVERNMCKKKWKRIDYNSIPIGSKIKHKKTFEKHFLKKLKNESKKENFFPDKIIGFYNKIELETKLNKKNEKNWTKTIEKYRDFKPFLKILPIIDTTGSMYGRYTRNLSINDKYYLNIAIGTGLLISKNLPPPFKSLILTFNKNPELFYCNCSTLLETIKQILEIETTFELNLYNIYRTYLKLCKDSKIDKNKTPEKFLIFTDQRLEKLDPDFKINLSKIQSLFENEPYQLPELYIWNLSSKNFQFNQNKFVKTIYGFDKYIYQIFLEYGNLDFQSILQDKITKY